MLKAYITALIERLGDSLYGVRRKVGLVLLILAFNTYRYEHTSLLTEVRASSVMFLFPKGAAKQPLEQGLNTSFVRSLRKLRASGISSLTTEDEEQRDKTWTSAQLGTQTVGLKLGSAFAGHASSTQQARGESLPTLHGLSLELEAEPCARTDGRTLTITPFAAQDHGPGLDLGLVGRATLTLATSNLSLKHLSLEHAALKLPAKNPQRLAIGFSETESAMQQTIKLFTDELPRAEPLVLFGMTALRSDGIGIRLNGDLTLTSRWFQRCRCRRGDMLLIRGATKVKSVELAEGSELRLGVVQIEPGARAWCGPTDKAPVSRCSFDWLHFSLLDPVGT